MGWFNKVVSFFVKDSVERRRFIDEFNTNARYAFQNITIDALFEAVTCAGNINYRHDLSAPTVVSGIEIRVKGGTIVPVDDILQIGKLVLLNEALVRRIYILHWDTLIIRDTRNGAYVEWRITDFLNFGGLLY